MIFPMTAEGLHFMAGDVEIIRGIDLTLRAGGPTMVIGPNGAGKSVLLRLLHGLLRPTAGRVAWALPEEAARRRQAMVFQRPVMLRRSVLANAQYPLKLAGLDPARAMAALERVGLSALAGRPARRLSGGEQQRLALARAWAMGPEVLFLDEPTASLDPAIESQALETVRQVEAIVCAIAAQGTKVVMTTHDLGQARRLAEEVVLVVAGRVNAAGRAPDFFERPPSEEAAAFLRGDLLW